jgi:tetratricopeptide (TPR) repeat protein
MTLAKSMALSLALLGVSLGVDLSAAQSPLVDHPGQSRFEVLKAALRAHLNSDDATAVKLYKRALSMNKVGYNDTGVLNCLARSYFSLKQYQQSIKVSDEAIKIASEAMLAVPKLFASSQAKDNVGGLYLQRSKSEMALGLRDRAIADLTSAIEVNPLDPGYFQWRARLYCETGRNSDAVTDLTKALDLDSSRMSGKLNKMDIFKLHTRRVELLNQRAKAYRNLGKTKEYSQDTAEAEKLTEEL